MIKLLLSSLFQTLGCALLGAVFGLGTAVAFGFELTWDANWLWLLISLPITYLFILVMSIRERNQNIRLGRMFTACFVGDQPSGAKLYRIEPNSKSTK